MNESGSIWLNVNALLIISEIAAVLAIILIAITIFSYRKRIRMKSLTVDFLDDVKINEAQREEGLAKKLDEATSLDDLEKGVLVKSLVDSEKKAYLHIAQLYMGYKPESLIDLEDEVKSISDNYIDIIEKVSQNPAEDSGGSSGGDNTEQDDAAMRELKKQVTFLREEKKDLKLIQSNILAQDRMASLGMMLAGITHELRNPMNFILNFSKINEELSDDLKKELTKNSIDIRRVTVSSSHQ